MQPNKTTSEQRAYVRHFVAPRNMVLGSIAIAILADLEVAERAKAEYK